MQKENKTNCGAIIQITPAVIVEGEEEKRNIQQYGCVWSLEFVEVKMKFCPFFMVWIGPFSFIVVVYFLPIGGDTCTVSF